MKLENNITIYNDILQELVDYVNEGWKKNYKVENVVGIEWGAKFMFVHFNSEDFTDNAYPVKFTFTLNKS